MSRKTPFLFLLLALLAVVILSNVGGDPDPAESPKNRIGAPEPDLYSKPGPHQGIEWSSWSQEAAEARAEAEENDLPVQPETPERPPSYTVEDDANGWIPEPVRERLARDYVGLDIAVARPHREKEPGVRK